MKRRWKSFWSWMLCICLLLQPLPSLAMDGETKTEQKITVSLNEGGCVKVTDPKGTESEIWKTDTGDPVTLTGTKGEVFQCEAVPLEEYEISAYVIIVDGKEEAVPEEELQGETAYCKELTIGDQAMEVRVEFQKKESKIDSADQTIPENTKPQETESTATGQEDEVGKKEDATQPKESAKKKDSVKLKTQESKQESGQEQESSLKKEDIKEHSEESSDADRKALTKEGTNETSDMEALFGPKEGEEDTRLSAQAWKRTQQKGGTDRALYADYTASREWHDVTIGTNDDSGQVIWQWTEGKLYIGGRLTFCMDATTSFYEGVQYTPTDMTALGLTQTEVTRLALYQEYIYNQRTDLDDLGRYMYTQMLIWRELNEYLGWGWPNIHIFEADYPWATVEYQERVLTEAVNWVQEQERSGKYTGHGEFFVHSYSQAQAIFWVEENNGGIELYKSSSKPEITDGNSAYSLAGAQYGVYRDGGDYVNPDAVITTDANGYGWVDGLPVGNYWIKELKAPPGYALNPAWSDSTIAVPGGAYVTYNTSDVPITDPITIVLGKVDADKTSGMSEAELKKLEGAQFVVKYYAVDPNAYNSDPGASGVKAERTWVLQTKYDSATKRVVAKLDPKYKVSGDEFFFNQSGWAVFPVGLITIQEIKAPQGYLVNNEIFVRKITEDGSDSEQVNTYNAPTVQETPQKMQIRLQKVDKETGKGEAQGTATLKGAKYEIRNSQNQVIETLITDEKGKAASKELPIATYTVKETQASNGYLLDEKTYTVKGEATDTVTRVFQYDVKSQETPQKIRIKLKKVDAETNKGEAQGTATLKGAKYEVRNSQNQVVETLITDENGLAMSSNLPLGTYTVKETAASHGYLLDEKTYTIEGNATDTTTQVFQYDVTSKETPQKIQIKLNKVDSETNKGEPQGAATLKGAVYEVRNAKNQVVDTLVTNERGEATSKELPLGNYKVKETKASYGYLLDEKTYTIEGNATDLTTRVFQYQVTSKEVPQKIQIELSKLDSETNQGEPQGAATLKGAVYEIRNSKKELVDTLTTDEKGKATSKELPLGEYTVKETKASNGYLVDPQSHTVHGSATDTTTRVFKYKVNSGEDIIRGDVEIIKLKENQDEDNDTLEGLEGVEFTFTSKTTRKEVLKIVTDEYGFATTKSKEHPRGGLVYDTYIVTETKCPEGLKPIEPFEVTIKDEGVTLKGIYKEDKLIVSPVSVVKVDASTGKVIPVADTEFRILDENKKPITMTTHYPNEVMHETFKTDKNGQFTLPEKLKYGTYYLEEVNAPDGYLKGELLQFKVTEGATWEHPMIVKYSDENAMGRIRIQKKDSETGAALANAVFDIVAAEDIVTPDGTIRLQKGEVAETITTGKDGSAISKELFLGTYLVKETKQPEGYLLNKKEYEITLKYQDQETPVVEAEAEIPNVPTKIQIVKNEKGTDNPVAGAKFQIWNKAMFEAAESEDQEMALKETYITDKKGCIELKYLAPGTYCIQEVEAAPGFVLDDTVRELTIDREGRIDGEKIGRLEVENDYTKMEFIKYDATTKKPVAGGTFQVTDLNGTVLDEWDGTKEPHTMDHLVVGQEYIFKEVKAPNGYLLAEDVHFVVEQTGKLQTIEMYDENVMGQITIRKTDANTDQGLKDAEFTITASEDIVTPDGTVQVKKGEIADTITTDEGGVAVSKKLFLGNYIVKESKQPSGYVLEDKEYPVELKYKDEKTDLITEELTVENKPTVIRLLKVDQEIGKAMAGVQFEIWKKNVPESGTEKEDHVIQTTDENGEIRIERFAPGTYCFQEHQTLPGYVLDETIHEVTISKDGTIDGKTVAVLKLKNVPTKLVKTTAKDQDTQTHEAIPKKETTLVDTVEFQDLQIGQEYTIKGTLMDKATGKPLLINGKEVTAETTFTAKEKDGTVDVVFRFDASALKGKQIVVFEKVFIEEKEILAHEDLEDQGQTVEFPDSSIGTTARDQESGTHEGVAKKEVTIIDTVSYKNLIVGQEYTVKGKLMLKETGKPLQIDGKEVTAEMTFVPEEADGSVDMEFTFDASALNKKSVVVFEKVYADEIEVAAHEDLEDEGQTVKYKIGKVTVDMPDKPGEGQGSPPVKTGDAMEGMLLLLFAAVGSVAVIGVVLYRRKRKEAQDEE